MTVVVLTLGTAAFLSALGLVLFLIGKLFQYQGLATIGAVILVGVGVVVATGGLMVQTGEEVVDTADGETTDYQYEEFDPPSNLPLGELIIIGGGVMVLRVLDEGGNG